jgi:hypothetical protein
MLDPTLTSSTKPSVFALSSFCPFTGKHRTSIARHKALKIEIATIMLKDIKDFLLTPE